MAEGARVSRGGYSLPLAGRHLVVGAYRPREAMREACVAGFGEPWRLALFLLSSVLVILVDPADDALAPLFTQYVSALGSGAALAEAGYWTSVGLLLMLAFYWLSTSIVWLFGRPTEQRPNHATVRSAIAMASWVSVLPILAIGLLAYAMGDTIICNTLVFFVWVAFAGICLSQATGLASYQGTAFAFGGLVLSVILLILVIVLFVTQTGLDAFGLIEGIRPQDTP